MRLLRWLYGMVAAKVSYYIREWLANFSGLIAPLHIYSTPKQGVVDLSVEWRCSSIFYR